MRGSVPDRYKPLGVLVIVVVVLGTNFFKSENNRMTFVSMSVQARENDVCSLPLGAGRI